MITFKQFLSEASVQVLNVKSITGRNTTSHVIKNPNLLEFLNFHTKHTALPGGFLDSKGDLWFFASDSSLHLNIIDALRLDVNSKHHFRYEIFSLKWTVFIPSPSSRGLVIANIKRLQKMMKDKKRPFVVLMGAGGQISVDGKVITVNEFEELSGLNTGF